MSGPGLLWSMLGLCIVALARFFETEVFVELKKRRSDGWADADANMQNAGAELQWMAMMMMMTMLVLLMLAAASTVKWKGQRW